MSDTEAMVAYTAMDFAETAKLHGFTALLEECVKMLNREHYQFTEEEKDAIGMLLTTERM